MNRPNFIVFLTDDQGYGDLSCMGAADFCTPHLDDLAASGVRFTSWYSNSPVCSPSRAALLTGRYPGNAGVRYFGGLRTTAGLPPSVPTIATALKVRLPNGDVREMALGLIPGVGRTTMASTTGSALWRAALITTPIFTTGAKPIRYMICGG